MLLQAILPQIQIVTETATTYYMKEPSVCSLWMSTLTEIPRPGGLFKLNHPHLPWYRHSQVSRYIALGGFGGAPLLGTQVGAGAAGPLGHPPTNWRLTRHAEVWRQQMARTTPIVPSPNDRKIGYTHRKP